MSPFLHHWACVFFFFLIFLLVFLTYMWHYFLKILFYFVEKQKGANRSLQRTAMITASHAYLVTRSKNIKKWHVFSGSPVLLQGKSVKETVTPLIKSIVGQPCKSNQLGGQITMLCSKTKKKEWQGLSRWEQFQIGLGTIQRWHFWNMLQPVINMYVRLD